MLPLSHQKKDGAYAVLTPLSRGYSPPRGRFLRVTQPFATPCPSYALFKLLLILNFSCLYELENFFKLFSLFMLSFFDKKAS